MSQRDRSKNAVLNLLDLTFLDEHALAAPSLYGAAVSTVCDLACPHCMRESLGIRENQLMDFDKFAAHKEELKAARRISLYGLGEPLLHPRFFDFARLCKETGVEVMTSTHGMSLTPEVREKIVEIGLDEVNISMDGADKKIFEETRVNAIFETVVANVTALSELKKARGVSLPLLNINMTIMRKNLHQVPEFIRLAHRMGVQSVTYSSIVVYKEADAHNNVLDTPEFEKTMEEARRTSEKLKIPMSFWRQKPVGWEPDFHDPNAAYGCVFLWSNQIIERDGLMKLCCYIEEDITNVFESGPKAAFNSEPLRRERRALMEGRVRPECQGCLYLRERSPSWMQALINQATQKAMEDANLSDEDRRELIETIARIQTKKDALFPRHGHRKLKFASVGSGGNVPTTNATELPLY